jgi:DNA-binding Lrp family transcriptional regulator
MKESRNTDGRFSPEHTDEEILAATRAHEPAATSEVAEEVGMTRQGADRRLRRLRDAGRVSSKKIGASLVWFAPDPDGDQEPTDAARVDADTDATDGPTDPPTDAHGAHTGAEEGALDAALAELPSTVDPDAARDAILAAREYLRAEGPASKAAIVRAVMPEHPLGYDAEDALEKIDTDGERYRGAWWRVVIKPGLEAADGVEKPPRGGRNWNAPEGS